MQSYVLKLYFPYRYIQNNYYLCMIIKNHFMMVYFQTILNQTIMNDDPYPSCKRNQLTRMSNFP